MVSPLWTFEAVAGPFDGPITGLAWADGGLLFAVPGEMAVKRYDPESGGVQDWRRYTGRITGLAVGPAGSVFAAQESGRRVIEFVADGSARVTATRFNGAIHNFPCDVAVDGAGRVWFADSHTGVQVFGPRIYPLLEHASVMRLEKDDRRAWKMVRATVDTLAPRAVLLSPDDRTLYVAEGETARPGPRELRAYPVHADGSLGRCRVLLAFGSDDRGAHAGIEGLCRDERGWLLACGGRPGVGAGGTIYLFDPQGRLREVQPFVDGVAPLRCALGGAAQASLYVGAGDGRLYRAAIAL
jgi:gluconolactonase